MSVLRDAFNVMLSLKSRSVTLTRLPSTTVNITVSPSNFFRNTQTSSEMIVRGREFMISKDVVASTAFPLPIKRGDRIQDTEMGLCTIDEVEELFDLGGALMGYRVRTN